MRDRVEYTIALLAGLIVIVGFWGPVAYLILR